MCIHQGGMTENVAGNSFADSDRWFCTFSGPSQLSHYPTPQIFWGGNVLALSGTL